MNKIGASVFDFSVSLPNTSWCLKIVIKTYTWNNNSVRICVCVCIVARLTEYSMLLYGKVCELPAVTQMHLLFLAVALCCHQCALGFTVKN